MVTSAALRADADFLRDNLTSSCRMRSRDEPLSGGAGTVVAQLEPPPISRFTLALFCGASGDHNPVHVDMDFARAAGHQDVFAQGMLVMAYLGMLLPRPDSSVRVESFTCRF